MSLSITPLPDEHQRKALLEIDIGGRERSACTLETVLSYSLFSRTLNVLSTKGKRRKYECLHYRSSKDKARHSRFIHSRNNVDVCCSCFVQPAAMIPEYIICYLKCIQVLVL